MVIAPPIEPIPPIEVPEPGGGTSNLPWMKGIPTQGVPLHFGKGDQATWHGVYGWLKDQWDAYTSTPVGLDTNLVFRAIFHGIELQREVLATYINLTNDYLLAVAIQSLTNDLRTLNIVATQFFQQQLTNWNLAATDNVILHTYLPALAAENARIRTYIGAVIPATTAAIESWVIHDTYVPLHQRIVQEDIERHADTAQIRNTAIPNAVRSLLQRITPIATVAATALAAANSVKTWIDDCGAPMCEQLGPKSKLGNLLKQLEPLLALLAGVEVAHLTEHELERLAGTLANVDFAKLTDFMDAFVSGGETVGDAAGTILGELSDLGGDVLRDIGVPV